MTEARRAIEDAVLAYKRKKAREYYQRPEIKERRREQAKARLKAMMEDPAMRESQRSKWREYYNANRARILASLKKRRKAKKEKNNE